MTESQTQTAPAQTDELFDRYTLPKVALAVILAASLIGTWVTTTLSGTTSLRLAVAKWAYFVAMGVLTGGLVWKHLFVRPADLGDGATEYCAEMYDRFDYVAAGAVAVLATAGVVVIWGYGGQFGVIPMVGYATMVAVWLALTVLTTYRRDPVERQFRSLAGLATLALALTVVAVTGITEVAMVHLNPVAAGVRVLHLLSFAVWIGGAVWNIFVAVPTGQERATIAVVRAAGEQLERFRWAVRFVIPTLSLTGLYQAVDGFGTSIGLYLGTAVGLAILVKIGFIGLLVVIFKLCPMWRACSPIEGVCELEDIGGGDTGGNTSPHRDPHESASGVTKDD